MGFNLSDPSGLARWDRAVMVKTNISILGWEDPLFTLGTNGTTTRVVTWVDKEYYINASDGNTSSLYDHIAHGDYIASDAAPNYIQRMEGSFAADTLGIESLVNYSEFDAQYQYTNLSSADFLYFSDGLTYTNRSVGGTPPMPSWFRLDNMTVNGQNRTTLYDADGFLN